ncbi:MAG: lysylphosphatidylglycerol synthase transmembrane domain-containing protein [Cyclobacteriaceae bacterium]
MSQFKSYLKYIISLAIAGLLLWYVFRDFELENILSKLKEVDYRWVGLAVVIFLVSHTLRAYRWNTMLKPLGFRQLTTFRTLLAVMIGYFANLIVPRMGEVSRCGVLKKTDIVPITTSLGTVVAERVVDLACLLTAVIALFVIEFDRVNGFMLSFFQDKLDQVGQNVFALYLLTALAFVALLVFFLLGRTIKKKLKHNTLYAKIRTFVREMLRGLTSISRIENKAGFWLATFLIWLSYFLMSYVVFFSLPETAGLGWRAGLAVLVMGSLGMAAPVQGGFGTFHALVSGVLLLYGIAEQEGVLFATLIHTMQTVCFILFGGISFFLASVISTRAPQNAVQESMKS